MQHQLLSSNLFTTKKCENLPSVESILIKCGIAEENRPTGAKFPMEIIDL